MRYNEFLSSVEETQEIDIIVSRDCSLKCSYCYLQKKKDEFYDMDAVISTFRKSLEEAKNKKAKGIVVSFYPEPWVNIQRSNELITKAVQIIVEDGTFIDTYMISLGTNGVNLHKKIPIVEKLLDRVSIAVTLDGIQEQHDKYRVFPNGSPSWEVVKKNILDNQFRYRIFSTKVTYGPDTLQYIYKSSIFLWEEMGFTDVNMNVVFENLWGDKENKEKLLDIFEEQISLLTDDIISNRRWEKEQYNSLVGSRLLPYSSGGSDRASPYCGATVMRSIDSDGELYPCFRLSPYALNEDKRFAIKNKETARTLMALNTFDTALTKCRTCPFLQNCSMCVGGAFDDNKESSIYWRTMYHCEFLKIQAKYAKKVYDAMNPNELYENTEGKGLVDEIRKVCDRGF